MFAAGPSSTGQHTLLRQQLFCTDADRDGSALMLAGLAGKFWVEPDRLPALLVHLEKKPPDPPLARNCWATEDEEDSQSEFVSCKVLATREA